MAYYSGPGYQTNPALHTNPAYSGTQEKYRPGEVGVPMNTATPDAPKWSWCSTGWSMFATFCCYSLCGFMGLLFSIWAYVDHKSGDYDRASFKRRWSWGCSIFGILLTILVIVAIFVIIFVFRDDICEELTAKQRQDWDICTWDI